MKKNPVKKPKEKPNKSIIPRVITAIDEFDPSLLLNIITGGKGFRIQFATPEDAKYYFEITKECDKSGNYSPIISAMLNCRGKIVGHN